MKKLFCTLALVAACSAANAASITWGSFDEFFGPTGESIDSGTAFLVLLDGDTSPSYTEGAWTLNGKVIATNSFSDAGGYWDQIATGIGYAAGDWSLTSNYVAVVTTKDVTSLSDLVADDWYFVTEQKTMANNGLLPGQNYEDNGSGQIWFEEDGLNGQLAWAQIPSGGSDPDPGPGPVVPEPTALALLALGVAGLALRRKA